MLLNSILLIDDDFAANYHQVELIRRLKVFREVFVKADGDAALEFLTIRYYSSLSLPSLIILNINMANGSGPEFLNKLVSSQLLGINRIPVALLTEPGHDDYQELEYKAILCSLSKPLNEEKIVEILTNTASVII